MGLRCSLLGHDFGDVVVEHDRDERGEEVVVTERELRECRRCGTESIVSENTEVRRRRPDEDHERGTDRVDSEAASGGPGTAGESDPASLVEEAETSEAAREQAEGDAIILDDETETTEPAPADEGPTESTDDEPADEGPVDATDDEPLDAPDEAMPEKTETTAENADEQAGDARTEPDPAGEPTPGRTASDSAESQPGSWPGEESVEDPTAETDRTGEPWPNHPETGEEADDVGPSAGSEDERRTGGASPSESGFEFAASTSNSSDPESPQAEPSSGIVRKGSIDLTGPPDGSVDGVLVCPACRYEVPVARSSNRPGDICPECHAGYLAEDR